MHKLYLNFTYHSVLRTLSYSNPIFLTGFDESLTLFVPTLFTAISFNVTRTEVCLWRVLGMK